MSSVAEAQLKTTDDSLPYLVKGELGVWIRSGHQVKTEVDIVDVNRDIEIGRILTTRYDELLSVALDCHRLPVCGLCYAENLQAPMLAHQKYLEGLFFEIL